MSTLTKIFIVLQLVFSIGLAVVVVMTVGTQNNLGQNLRNEVAGRTAAQAAVSKADSQVATAEQQLQNVQREAAEVQTRLTRENADLLRQVADRQTSLEKAEATNMAQLAAQNRLTIALTSLQERLTAREREIDQIRPELARLQQRAAEVERANQQLTNENSLAAKQIRTLQEMLASRPAESTPPRGGASMGAPASVAQMSAGASAPVQINGKITRVQEVSGKTYLSLGLGSRDGVQEGTSFMLYRGNTYLGDATIQKVTADESVAVVTQTAKGQSIRSNDMAISGGGL